MSGHCEPRHFVAGAAISKMLSPRTCAGGIFILFPRTRGAGLSHREVINYQLPITNYQLPIINYQLRKGHTPSFCSAVSANSAVNIPDFSCFVFCLVLL